MVMWSFLGVEMIGITAGETKNPEKNLAKAIDTVFWRILIFYVGALFVIMSIYPWNEVGTTGSPFVMTFDKIGIPAAAGIINFVVLTAALSSCNAGIFSTARMLYDLADRGEAPKLFSKISKNGVPIYATIATACILIIGVVLNYLVPSKVFMWITAISTFGALWTWAMILISQLRFRKTLTPEQKKALKYPMPLFPVSNYISLAFLVLVAVLMGFFPDTRISLFVGPPFILILVAAYYIGGFHKKYAKTESSQDQKVS
jgi:AAT family amino acid transporter